MSMTDCIIYARFSPRPDKETSDSNIKQIEACREYAKEQGWRVMSVHEDCGRSRDDPEREGIADAIESLRRGTVLLCYDSSRFGGGAAAVIHEDRIKKKGGRLAFVHGGMAGDTPEAQLFRSIMYAFNAYQKATIGARSRKRMKQAQRDGHIRSKLLPYGYKHDPEDEKRMVIDPEEWPVVEYVLGRMKEGATANAVAGEMNDLGMKPQGRWWHRNTVKRIWERERHRVGVHV